MRYKIEAPYGGQTTAGSQNSIANGVINGDMAINQIAPVNTATTISAATGTEWNNTDMCGVWSQSLYLGGQANDQQLADHPILAAQGFCKAITATANVAAPGSSEAASVFTTIEGYNFRPFFGQTAILSFWASSPKTGIHSVAFVNKGIDRSYVAEYVVSQANVWQQFSVGVVFNYTGGTFNYTNDIGIRILFPLAAGSSRRTTPGSWKNGFFVASTNQQNLMDTTGNRFKVTDVQLTQGIVALAYQRTMFNQALLNCQRYYCNSFSYGTVPANNTGQNGLQFPCSVPPFVQDGTNDWTQYPTPISPNIAYPIAMRAIPTVTLYSPTTAGTNGKVIPTGFTGTTEIAAEVFATNTTDFNVTADPTVTVGGIPTSLNMYVGTVLSTNWASSARI